MVDLFIATCSQKLIDENGNNNGLLAQNALSDTLLEFNYKPIKPRILL
jgi:hypothetical protein